MSYVRCICGTVYDTVGTTTGMTGCCPKCGLHHSGQYRVVKPILKPSPLEAKPIDATEKERMNDYKSITGETLSRIPALAAMAEAELNHCDPSIMARMEIGLKACDGIESLLNLLVESGMISTCKLAISEVIRCETCGHLHNPCSHMSDLCAFCSEWEPIRERGVDAV